MEILQRIAPKAINEFLGNRIQINKVKEYITSPKSYGTILYVIGPDGCGKTTMCNLLFSKAAFNVLEVSKANFTLKELNASLNSFVRNKNIECFFNKKQKVVFIDDIDVLMNIEKAVLSTVTGYCEDFARNKVLCVACCNLAEEKKVLEIKKNAEVVKLSYPQTRDVYAYLLGVVDELGVDEDILLPLVTKHRGCIRDIVMNMHFGKQEPAEAINFKDMNNFEVVSWIFRNGIKIADIDRVYKDDAGLVGFIMYENLPDEMYYHKDLGRKASSFMDPLKRCSDLFIDASVVENFMYTSGSWGMFDLINVLRINGMSMLLSDMKDKKVPKDYKYRFSQTLSKISHKNILNKKIKALQAQRDMSYDNMFLLADIALQKGMKKKANADETNFINTYEKYFGAE